MILNDTNLGNFQLFIPADMQQVAVDHTDKKWRSAGQGVDVVDGRVLVEFTKASVRLQFYDYNKIIRELTQKHYSYYLDSEYFMNFSIYSVYKIVEKFMKY